MVEIIHGLNITISCSAMGYPTPSLKWYFKGVEIVLNDSIYITFIPNGDTISSLLTIESVSYPKHQGVYVCMAENSEGIDSAAIQLDIQCEFQ